MIIYQFGRCLRPVLFAHTAQALATRPVSASIANAVLFLIICYLDHLAAKSVFVWLVGANNGEPVFSEAFNEA